MRKKQEWHGKTKTKEYKAWECMKTRCLNPNCKAYLNYGGRGITIQPEWLKSFVIFLKEVRKAPTPESTLERVDNSIGYIKGNVVWASRRTQANNRRGVKLVKYKNKILPLSYASDLVGIPYKTLWRRLKIAKTNCLDGYDYTLKSNQFS